MIVSASRRTDLSAFYSDWFFRRLEAGFADARNPVNPRRVSRISLAPRDVELFVFWTKNPAPMLERLDRVESPFYFQFTLTPYGRELEPGLPDKAELCETFRRLSRVIGRERVVWRYDPIVLGGRYDEAYHLRAFEALCREVGGYARQCTVSFLDLYRRNRKEMAGFSGEAEAYRVLAGGLSRVAKRFQLPLFTCSEELDLSGFGISHAACVDPLLARELVGKELKLPKDKGQRPACGCVQSVDIGAYHCCMHGCRYCYANGGPAAVKRNFQNHDPSSTMLLGYLREGDEIFGKPSLSTS